MTTGSHERGQISSPSPWTQGHFSRRVIREGEWVCASQRLGEQFTHYLEAQPGKECTCNAGDLGSIPGLGRFPGDGNGYSLQCSGLENSIDCIYSPWDHKELDMTEQLLVSQIL